MHPRRSQETRRDHPRDRRRGERRRAGHAREARARIVEVQKIPFEARRATVEFALDRDPHRGEVLLALLVGPLRKEQFRQQIARPHRRAVADRHRIETEEPGLAQHPHQFDVAGIPQRALAHVGNRHALHEAAKPIGVEGLERADAGELDELGLRERLLDDDRPALDEPRRAHVLLDHVVRREARLVLVGPRAAPRQAADHDVDAVGAIEATHARRREHVAQARRDAAVDDRGHALPFRKLVELLRIVVHEGDVAVGPLRLEHRSQGIEAEAARQRADDEIGVLRKAAHHRGLAAVGDLRGDAPAGDGGAASGVGKRRLVAVDDRHAVAGRRGEIRGEHRTHETGTEDEDLRHRGRLRRRACLRASARGSRDAAGPSCSRARRGRGADSPCGADAPGSPSR